MGGAEGLVDHETDPSPQIDRALRGASGQHVAFFEQACQRRCRPTERTVADCGDHRREAWVQRKLQHGAPIGGQRAFLVDGTQQFENVEGFFDRSRGWLVEQAKVRRACHPPGQGFE